MGKKETTATKMQRPSERAGCVARDASALDFEDRAVQATERSGEERRARELATRCWRSFWPDAQLLRQSRIRRSKRTKKNQKQLPRFWAWLPTRSTANCRKNIRSRQTVRFVGRSSGSVSPCRRPDGNRDSNWVALLC